MLGIIFGAAGMVFVYYTVQTIFGPVVVVFYLGYYTGIGDSFLCVLINAILFPIKF